MIRTLALKGATALVAGMFCLGAAAPSTVLAQDRAATEMKAKTTAKTTAKTAAKTKTVTATRAAPRKSVMALQTALNKNGARLAVDGRMGKKTRDALRAWQKANGLKASGVADKATKAKLGL